MQSRGGAYGFLVLGSASCEWHSADREGCPQGNPGIQTSQTPSSTPDDTPQREPQGAGCVPAHQHSLFPASTREPVPPELPVPVQFSTPTHHPSHLPSTWGLAATTGDGDMGMLSPCDRRSPPFGAWLLPSSEAGAPSLTQRRHQCHFGPQMFSGVGSFCRSHHKPSPHVLPNLIVPCRDSLSSSLTFLSFSGFGHACLPAHRHPGAPAPCQAAALIWRGHVATIRGPAASGMGAVGWRKTPPHLHLPGGAQGGR